MAFYVAAEPSDRVRQALNKLGVEKLNDNVWAMVPDEMTREETLDRLSQENFPLFEVTEEKLMDEEEFEQWIDC